MAQVNNSPELPDKTAIAAEARKLIREAIKGSLATLDSPTGAPYASLITLATDSAGAPIFLISTLARHTRNLAHDSRAAILIDATGGGAGNGEDPLQGARITVTGRAERTQDDAVRRRFLARQAQAGFYADFPDFSFWRLAVEGAHFVGGFGRIVDLAPEDLLIPLAGAEAVVAAEDGIVAHMNEDHADALALYAQAFGGDAARGDASWRMTGVDPEGCDLLQGSAALRIPFATRVLTPGDARKELVRLVDVARAKIS